MDGAVAWFNTALASTGGTRNTVSGLGGIAEQGGAPTGGLFVLHESSLRSILDMPAFRKRLVSLQGSPSQTAATSTASPCEYFDAPPPVLAKSAVSRAELGVYEFLIETPTAAARQTVAVMDSLRMSVRPTLTSYLGGSLHLPRGLLLALIPLAASVVALATCLVPLAAGEASPYLDVALFAVAIFNLPVMAILNDSVFSIRYTIERGRLQIRTDSSTAESSASNCTESHDVQLTRNLVNVLTRDGTLIFKFAGGQPDLELSAYHVGRN